MKGLGFNRALAVMASLMRPLPPSLPDSEKMPLFGPPKRSRGKGKNKLFLATSRTGTVAADKRRATKARNRARSKR
jgi:hypothetical protein